jgi:hypothetical protein
MERWASRWVRRQWRREGRVRKILMLVFGIVEPDEEGGDGLQAWAGGEVERFREADIVIVGVKNVAVGRRRRGRMRGIIDIAWLCVA